MDLLAERGRRISVDELNTTRLLAHARKQAVQRKLDDIVIVDVDAHHYENEHYSDILPYMENDVFRQWTMGGRGMTDRGAVVPTNAGFIQDMGGRVTRYPLRRSEKTEQGGKHRDVQLGERWMDAMSVDYSCLFPTGMLNIGMHPQKEMEADLCWAYNRWVTEKVLPEADGRMYSMLCLPFSDPAACVRQVETFGSRKHVTGFMVTTVRHLQVNDNAYMRLYRMMGERFPKLPVIWIESGLAWVPFLMQRLDHEFMMRPSEAPLLKKKPSDYMRDMYYSSQPIEIQDRQAMECTFRMINAETQLLYSSDYPHWDFDLPATIYDLPFLSEKAKHNILGGTAARLFKLPPRNEKQKENPKKFGNDTAAA